MIKLIVGAKGSGKTKTMIDMINNATKTTSGNICFYISLVIYQTAYGIEITILWALYTTVTVVQLAISIGI